MKIDLDSEKSGFALVDIIGGVVIVAIIGGIVAAVRWLTGK